MDDPTPIDGQLLRGLLDALVLDALQRAPNYGFGLLQTLENGYGFSAGEVKEATLYPLLHRLEARGHLASHNEPGDRGRPRRYYRVTEAGAEFLSVRLEEWRRIAEILDRTLLRRSARNPGDEPADQTRSQP